MDDSDGDFFFLLNYNIWHIFCIKSFFGKCQHKSFISNPVLFVHSFDMNRYCMTWHMNCKYFMNVVQIEMVFEAIDYVWLNRMVRWLNMYACLYTNRKKGQKKVILIDRLNFVSRMSLFNSILPIEKVFLVKACRMFGSFSRIFLLCQYTVPYNESLSILSQQHEKLSFEAIVCYSLHIVRRILFAILTEFDFND